MENKDKYYRPDLTEFKVGFRYEYNYNGWLEAEYIGNVNVEEGHGYVRTLKEAIEDGDIRVKYLDKSDIIELGFMSVREQNCDRFFRGRFYLPNTEWKLFVDGTHKRIYICFQEDKEYPNKIFFVGTIKNYNELEFILKSIGVIKDETKN